MNDLISRQEAIDALEREQSLVERPITETRWFDLGLRKAQDVLSELPSAQPEQLWITYSERLPELEDQTIYGFRVRDLALLASILRAKGVSPKEIEDWHKDLQGLLDFAVEQEMEAHRKAVADVLKGFNEPDEETVERFTKAIGRKGEEVLKGEN